MPFPLCLLFDAGRVIVFAGTLGVDHDLRRSILCTCFHRGVFISMFFVQRMTRKAARSAACEMLNIFMPPHVAYIT